MGRQKEAAQSRKEMQPPINTEKTRYIAKIDPEASGRKSKTGLVKRPISMGSVSLQAFAGAENHILLLPVAICEKRLSLADGKENCGGGKAYNARAESLPCGAT